MLKIVEYDEKYLEQISNIIIQDLLTVNSKDYGMERVKKWLKTLQLRNYKTV